MPAAGATAVQAGVRCATLPGDDFSPANGILEAAKRLGCDPMFVMALQGGQGPSRLISGSVTKGILAYAPVPMRPRADTAQPGGHEGATMMRRNAYGRD